MDVRSIETIRRWIREGAGGTELSSRLTEETDSLVKSVCESSSGSNILLLATGGYGRAELCPFSDIDIMFFAEDRSDTKTAEQTLYRLWDTGLQISHAFRTPKECMEEAFRDIRTRTAMIESRYLAGDVRLYDLFMKKVYPEITFRSRREFVGEKLKEMEKRRHDAGDSVSLLEPHIKEGEGGLRDIHTAYWLSKVVKRTSDIPEMIGSLSPQDSRRLAGAYDFLLRTRFCLHIESGRKNDVLSFEYQRGVAGLLRFRDSGKFSGPERMMRHYYLKSRSVREMTRKIMADCSNPYVPVRIDMKVRKVADGFAVSGGRLIATGEDVFESRPERIIECFLLYAKTGRRFSETLRDHVRANLLRIDRKMRNSGIALRHFRSVLKSDRVYETLREMNETGVLARLFPEFGALRSLVVHEPYHMYTVDVHTLMAVRNLEALKFTTYGHLRDLREIINGIADIDILYMALLFHDIGKAAGRRHEEEGYKRLKNIMERLGLDVKRRVKIEFLVRNHVLMSKIALHREADDEGVIASFADAVGDPENLKALYLITYADMSAVNPGFWTPWKAYLLRELYDRTSDHFLGIREDRASSIRMPVWSLTGVPVKAFAGFIGDMPERYAIATTGERAVRDFRMTSEAAETGFAMDLDKDADGIAEISISAKDRPGLFASIVGLLSSKGLNIVGGRIFTSGRGMAIDRIAVSNWNDIWWEGLEDDIRAGLKGVILEDRPIRISGGRAKTSGPYGVFIELDNEASGEYSIIEIFSPDRLGLLYDISEAMYREGLDIVSARIITETGLAQDVFYVRKQGRKIDFTGFERVLAALWAILS